MCVKHTRKGEPMTHQEKVRNAFRFYRSRDCNATVALQRARNDAAN